MLAHNYVTSALENSSILCHSSLECKHSKSTRSRISSVSVAHIQLMSHFAKCALIFSKFAPSRRVGITWLVLFGALWATCSIRRSCLGTAPGTIRAFYFAARRSLFPISIGKTRGAGNKRRCRLKFILSACASIYIYRDAERTAAAESCSVSCSTAHCKTLFNCLSTLSRECTIIFRSPRARSTPARLVN